MQSGENISSMSTKGVNVILQCSASHEALSLHKMLHVWVLRLLSFASSTGYEECLSTSIRLMFR